MSSTPITVPEFVQVRQHIANLLKENSSTQISTRIRQAENLLMAGVIDVQAVLDELAPEKSTPVGSATIDVATQVDVDRMFPNSLPSDVDEDDEEFLAGELNG